MTRSFLTFFIGSVPPSPSQMKGSMSPMPKAPYPCVQGKNKGIYLLLCGERCYLAAQKLGFETIPVRNVNTATQKDEILVLQLTENLQREDLNQ
jgi:hypothetical protein